MTSPPGVAHQVLRELRQAHKLLRTLRLVRADPAQIHAAHKRFDTACAAVDAWLEGLDEDSRRAWQQVLSLTIGQRR